MALTKVTPQMAYNFGSVSEPNNRLNAPNINKVADHATASHAQGGTAGLPMFIGWEYDLQTDAGDGVTTVFNYTLPFTVPDTSWSVRVASVRDSDNLYFPVSATITGKGSSSITITLSTALASGFTLIAQFLGENGDPTTQARLCYILGGYNNVANGLMDIVMGAHNRTIGPDDHNTILGGSNNLIVSGAYGTITGGTNVILGLNTSGVGMTGGGSGIRVDEDGATAFGLGSSADGRGATAIGLYANALAGGSAAIGQSVTASGAASFVAGKDNDASGLYSVTFGLNNDNDADYSIVTGRDNVVDGAADYTFVAGQSHDVDFAWGSALGYKSRNFNPGHHVRGYNGTNAGDRQGGHIGLYRQSTDNVIGSLGPITGSVRVVLPNDCVASVTGRIIAKEVGGTDCAMFTVNALLLQNAGTTTVKFGGTPTTVFADTGASAWTTAITGSANGILVRSTGDAGKTINWFAELQVQNIVG